MLDKYKKYLFSRRLAYKRVFNTPDGERVLADLYKYCGISKPSYREGKSDATARNEGMRAVALHIKGILRQSENDIDDVIRSVENVTITSPINQ
jgi:hypothetical protein